MISYIDKVLLMIVPTKGLFIAADGILPFPKLRKLHLVYHQRQTQYEDLVKFLEGSKEFGALRANLNTSKTLEIVPLASTSFSKELRKHLDFYVKRKMYEDERWKSVICHRRYLSDNDLVCRSLILSLVILKLSAQSKIRSWDSFEALHEREEFMNQ